METDATSVVKIERKDVATDVAEVGMEYSATWVVPVERDEPATLEGKLK